MASGRAEGVAGRTEGGGGEPLDESGSGTFPGFAIQGSGFRGLVSIRGVKNMAHRFT